jgi:hypothetical protein
LYDRALSYVANLPDPGGSVHGFAMLQQGSKALAQVGAVCSSAMHLFDFLNFQCMCCLPLAAYRMGCLMMFLETGAAM